MKADGEKLTIAVDLDGTLARFDKWQGHGEIGEPLPGAREAMQELVAAGHQVIVYTCRCSGERREEFGDGYTVEQSVELVREWLARHGFPELEIYDGHGKIFADYYCDDKAITVRPQDDHLAWVHVVARVCSAESTIAVTTKILQYLRQRRDADGGGTSCDADIAKPRPTAETAEANG